MEASSTPHNYMGEPIITWVNELMSWIRCVGLGRQRKHAVLRWREDRLGNHLLRAPLSSILLKKHYITLYFSIFSITLPFEYHEKACWEIELPAQFQFNLGLSKLSKLMKLKIMKKIQIT